MELIAETLLFNSFGSVVILWFDFTVTGLTLGQDILPSGGRVSFPVFKFGLPISLSSSKFDVKTFIHQWLVPSSLSVNTSTSISSTSSFGADSPIMFEQWNFTLIINRTKRRVLG